MRRSVRGIAVALTAVTTLAVAPLVTAQPAAALASCGNATTTFYKVHNGVNLWWIKPSTQYENGDYNCVLGRGNTGDGVLYLQHTLRFCYGQNIALDGIYGPATQQAVKNVQNFHNYYGGAGLVVDGVYGPKTRDHMIWGRFDSQTVVDNCNA